jgi:hypothetical protein
MGAHVDCVEHARLFRLFRRHYRFDPRPADRDLRERIMPQPVEVDGILLRVSPALCHNRHIILTDNPG